VRCGGTTDILQNLASWGRSDLMVMVSDWELGDQGSIPSLGKFFDPEFPYIYHHNMIILVKIDC